MYHVHFGVAGAVSLPTEGALPAGFLSDGDSFLVWGERKYNISDPMVNTGVYDGTVHVIAVETTMPDHERVSELRRRLAPTVIGFGERLFDYAVVTTAADWCWDDNDPDDRYQWLPREGEADLVY